MKELLELSPEAPLPNGAEDAITAADADEIIQQAEIKMPAYGEHLFQNK